MHVALRASVHSHFTVYVAKHAILIWKRVATRSTVMRMTWLLAKVAMVYAISHVCESAPFS
jgi:hypothetical protein